MEKSANENVEYIDIIQLLKRLWKAFKKLWYLVLILSVGLGSLMYFKAIRSYAPRYRSEAVFSVSVSYSGSTDISSYSYYYDSAAAQLAASSFQYILDSDFMKERLLQELGTPYINGSISATSIAETNFFVLNVTSSNPADAYKILNKVLEIYPQISSLALGETQFSITKEPSIPTAPINSPSWKKQTVMGAGIGFILGMGIVFVYSLVNRTVNNSEDLKNSTNLPCLCYIPEVKKLRSNSNSGILLTNQSGDSAFAEAFRLLRLKLKREMSATGAKVIMVTSSMPSEGKSSISANLGLSLAKDGKNVILIDGDLRAPNIKSVFGITAETVGLGEILQKSVKQVTLYQIPNTTLYLLAGDAVKEEPHTLLKYSRVRSILETLKASFDYVIIDTPPTGMISDAAAYAPHADLAIYVIREDYVTANQISEGMQVLTDNGTKILGYVFNRSSYDNKSTGSKYGYGYGKYGYGYGYGYGKKYGYGYSNGYGYKSSSDSSKKE